VIQTPQGQIGYVALLFIVRPRLRRSPRPLDASPVIPLRVRRHRSFSACLDPVSARRASVLSFVAQPSNLTVLWWTVANPACRLQSWASTLHRLLSMTSSRFSCHHAARTWPRWTPSPSSRAYLSLHSSEAQQGIDLSRPLFTCTNANQATSCTSNTQPRVSPHHVVNHSWQPRATIHRSSNAPVLILSCATSSSLPYAASSSRPRATSTSVLTVTSSSFPTATSTDRYGLTWRIQAPPPPALSLIYLFLVFFHRWRWQHGGGAHLRSAYTTTAARTGCEGAQQPRPRDAQPGAATSSMAAVKGRTWWWRHATARKVAAETTAGGEPTDFVWFFISSKNICQRLK
jgi:hypothetical protein